jgi:hypothetical protein
MNVEAASCQPIPSTSQSVASIGVAVSVSVLCLSLSSLSLSLRVHHVRDPWWSGMQTHHEDDDDSARSGAKPKRLLTTFSYIALQFVPIYILTHLLMHACVNRSPSFYLLIYHRERIMHENCTILEYTFCFTVVICLHTHSLI